MLIVKINCHVFILFIIVNQAGQILIVIIIIILIIVITRAITAKFGLGVKKFVRFLLFGSGGGGGGGGGGDDAGQLIFDIEPIVCNVKWRFQ